MTTPIRSHLRTGSTLLVLLLGSICATAQSQRMPYTQGSPATAKVETKTGDISGKVINESGQPLAGAQVYVRPTNAEGLSVMQTKTNREGVFEFSGLQRGSYTVYAAMSAYIPKSPEAGPVVSENSDAVTLVLIKGGVITGTVTNSKNDPVVAIAIRVEKVTEENGRPSARSRLENITDDRGVYRVYGLSAGTYIVWADGSANYSPTGVNAFSVDMPTYAPSSTRETADQISVRVGEETSNVDIRYRGEHGSTISGTVKGTRTGDRGFSVSLTSLADNGLRWNEYFQDVSGEFAFEGIPDGDYLLVATAYWNERDRGLSETMALSVRGSDFEGIELTAAPLASISGTVVLKELREPVPDCTDKSRPQFSDTTVSAWHRVIQSADKKKPQFVWRARGETPNQQGNLTFQGLAASEYYFSARLIWEQWYLQSIAFVPTTPGAKPTDATRSWTMAKAGEQFSGLTFTLAQGAALVRGKITLAEGQTLPGKLSIYLVPAEAAQAEDVLRYFAGPVNTDGGFWLHNVAPGRYWMVTRPSTDDTRQEVSKLRLPDAAETRSSLRHDAEKKKTEIVLKPCQNLTFKLPLL